MAHLGEQGNTVMVHNGKLMPVWEPCLNSETVQITVLHSDKPNTMLFPTYDPRLYCCSLIRKFSFIWQILLHSLKHGTNIINSLETSPNVIQS